LPVPGGEVAAMTDIRSRIDELIEESYLATLPEEAIRKDLLGFIDGCDKAVKASTDERKRQEMNQRLEMFRELALRVEKAPELADRDDQLAGWSQHDLVAHRAARMKLLVLEALRTVDHSVAERIERERFPKGILPQEPVVSVAPRRVRPAVRRPFLSPATTGLLLRVVYALLAGAILFILGYRLLH